MALISACLEIICTYNYDKTVIVSLLYIHCVLQSLLVSSVHTLCVTGLFYTYTVCCSLSWSLLYIHCVLQSLLVSSIHTLCVTGLFYTYTVCCNRSVTIPHYNV